MAIFRPRPSDCSAQYIKAARIGAAIASKQIVLNESRERLTNETSTIPGFFDRLTRLAVELIGTPALAEIFDKDILATRLKTFVSHARVLKIEAENPPEERSPKAIRASWEIVKNIGAEFRLFEEFKEQHGLRRALTEFLNSGPNP